MRMSDGSSDVCSSDLTSATPRRIIADASRTFGVPEAWIVAVMRAESGGHTMLDGRPITSRAGAMGLMQLMPASYADMRRPLDPGPNPHDPRDNLRAGTFHPRLMYERSEERPVGKECVNTCQYRGGA